MPARPGRSILCIALIAFATFLIVAIDGFRHDDARPSGDPKGGDGMKQLREKAKHEEHDRDHAFHLYHGYEYTSGGLQIAGPRPAPLECATPRYRSG